MRLVILGDPSRLHRGDVHLRHSTEQGTEPVELGIGDWLARMHGQGRELTLRIFVFDRRPSALVVASQQGIHSGGVLAKQVGVLRLVLEERVERRELRRQKVGCG